MAGQGPQHSRPLGSERDKWVQHLPGFYTRPKEAVPKTKPLEGPLPRPKPKGLGPKGPRGDRTDRLLAGT